MAGGRMGRAGVLHQHRHLPRPRAAQCLARHHRGRVCHSRGSRRVCAGRLAHIASDRCAISGACHGHHRQLCGWGYNQQHGPSGLFGLGSLLSGQRTIPPVQHLQCLGGRCVAARWCSIWRVDANAICRDPIVAFTSHLTGGFFSACSQA